MNEYIWHRRKGTLLGKVMLAENYYLDERAIQTGCYLKESLEMSSCLGAGRSS